MSLNSRKSALPTKVGVMSNVFDVIMLLKHTATERINNQQELASVMDALDRAEKELKWELIPYGYHFEYSHSDRFLKRKWAEGLLNMYRDKPDVKITAVFTK